jgi:hypothetical protein
MYIMDLQVSVQNLREFPSLRISLAFENVLSTRRTTVANSVFSDFYVL